MKLFSNIGATGGTTGTGELRITEPIGGLIFVLPNLLQLNNEVVSVWVESPTGQREIAYNVPLKSFISLGCLGEAAVTVDTDGNPSVLVEICEGGNLQIGEREEIKVELKSLNSNYRYEVHTLAYGAQALASVFFEKKTLLAGEPVREYVTRNFDAVCFNDIDQIETVEMFFANGNTVKYTPLDLKVIAASVDPLFFVDAENKVYTSISDNTVVMPLVGISKIKVRNVSANQAYNIVFKRDSNYKIK